MKREEVMALTDKGLIEQVELIRFPDTRIGYLADRLARFYPGDDGDYDFVPDYPHDIAAAWELWEKLPSNRSMSDDSLWIEIVCGPTLDRIDDTFLRISRRDEFDHPRAITCAFILARATQHNAPIRT